MNKSGRTKKLRNAGPDDKEYIPMQQDIGGGKLSHDEGIMHPRTEERCINAIIFAHHAPARPANAEMLQTPKGEARNLKLLALLLFFTKTFVVSHLF